MIPLDIPWTLPAGAALIRACHDDREILSITGGTLCATGTHVERAEVEPLAELEAFQVFARDLYSDARRERECERE